MSSVYEQLRLEGAFCDAVLKVGDEEFQVHKIVLCNCSVYLRALFVLWSPRDKMEYDVKDITPEIMRLIIKFAYTGCCSVTVDNVMDLMRAADQYNVMGVTEICRLFIEQQLCPDNCIGIWQFTSTCYCPDLQSKAYRYILDHFDEVILSEELLYLTAEELSDLFGRDDLIVRTESIVYEAMTRWISHMPDQREGHLHQLMSKIRIGLMDSVYLTNNVLTNDLVKTNTTCQDIITQVILVLSHRSNQRDNICFSNNFFRPRLPSVILLATGGLRGVKSTNAIEAYDTRIDHWVSVEPGAEQPQAGHGTAFLDGFLYFIGGFDGEEVFNRVRRFDPVRHIWEDVSSMKQIRRNVSVTTLNGCIYALGGDDRHNDLSSAERYQPQTNEWTFIASMNEERSQASCTTFQGKIYICGGTNESQALESAEHYNPETNEWTMISPMGSHRCGLGVVAYRDLIYAVGGSFDYEGEHELSTVEAYDPQTDTWTDRSPMRSKRSSFGIQVVEDCIFVVGGFDDTSSSTTVEKYDAALDVWTVAEDMNVGRVGLSCCVVHGLPNMDQYTMNRNSLQNLQIERVEEEEMEVEDWR